MVFAGSKVRRYSLVTGLLLLATGLAIGLARRLGPDQEQDKLKVVATTTVLCDLTRQIAQEDIRLTCLMEPGQDPHVYEPTPSDRRAIATADLILYGGYDLESVAIPVVHDSQSSGTTVAVYEAAVPQPLMGEAHNHDHDHEDHDDHDHEDHDDHDHEDHDDHDHEDHDDHDHEDHDDHDHEDHDDHKTDKMVPDPHIWHSARNGAEIVAVIRDNLVQLAQDQALPTQAQLYTNKAQTVITQLQQLDQWITTQVATVPQGDRKLVTTHDAFQYFAQAYGFTVAGALSGVGGVEKPSAARIAELIELVNESGVPTVFSEANTNPRWIDAIARDANVAVAPQTLFVTGPSSPGAAAETYQAMLVVNTCTIVNGLGGNCEAASAPIGEADLN